MDICSIDGCEAGVKARSWCSKHYQRWKAHGDPTHSKFIRGDTPRRVDSRVRKTPTCWLWEGGTVKGGYGLLEVAGHGVLVHRYNYERYIAPIPAGLCVLHKCDTPACVNPAHLEVGTRQDNSRQMVERNRQHRPSGELNSSAKLTHTQVVEIRASPNTCRTLSLKYGVSCSQISRIKLGKRWRTSHG